jgi:RHS repeat-associated protein
VFWSEETVNRRLLTDVSLILAVAISLSGSLYSQVPDPTFSAEAPVAGAGHHYIGVGAETVNPADGTLTFDLPLEPPNGRQVSMKFGLRFSGNEQEFLSNQGQSNILWWTWIQDPTQRGGWTYELPSLATQTSVIASAEIPYNGCPSGVCAYALNLCYGNDTYVFRGLDTVQNSLAIGNVYPDSSNSDTTYCTAAQKSPGNRHGLLAIMQNTNSGPPVQVVDASGTTYQFPGLGGGTPTSQPIMSAAIASRITDRNGNQITQNGNSYKDSTGRTVVSWVNLGSNGAINVSGLGAVNVVWTTTNLAQPETGHNANGNCQLSSSGGSSPIGVISEIDLPNGRKYTFQYDGTYAKPSKITFPDGGYVRYLWALNTSAKEIHAAWVVPPNPQQLSCDFIVDAPAVSDRYVSYDGTNEVLHQHFAYSTAWSGNSWTSKTTTVTSTDLLTNQVTATTYLYGGVQGDPNVLVNQNYYLNVIPVELTATYKDGAGKTYKVENKSWINSHLMSRDQTILYDSSGNPTVGSMVLRCFDANEQVTNSFEYGFQTEGTYPGTPGCFSAPTGTVNTSFMGPLRRQTTTVYHPFFSWNGNNIPPTYTGTHIVTAPDSVTVADGSNATVKQTLYAYDQYTPLQASGAINLSSVSGARANATTVQRLISGTTYATSTYHYYDTGQVYTMLDPCGNVTCSDITGSNHTTTYSYSDAYTTLSGGVNVAYTSPNGQTSAYLTQITDPLVHTTKFTYDYNNGQLTTKTDANNLSTSYIYNDPGLLARLTKSINPDGGQTTVTYNDVGPLPTVTTTKQINTSQSVTTVAVSDGMGHAVQSQLTSDPQGTVYRDETYDGFGRVWKQSNPYRLNDATSSPGTTVFGYDTLGRKLTEAYPDTSVLTTAYCGASTLVTDATGRWRRSRTDGLGLLVEVDEPNSPTATVASSGCPGTGEPIWVTTYSYDTVGDLASIVQNGSRSRSFTYDLLSRLVCSSNPENSSVACPANGGTLPSSGAVLYTYDANGNVNTKKDTRSITVTYGYDVVNRLLSRTYSNGDPTVTITYDQTACLGLSACQNIGYRTSMTDGAGSDSWAYQVDSANSRNVHKEQRTTSSITKPSTYYLDLAGNVTQLVYPTGRIVNYTYDAANRPSTAADSSNGTTYVTDWRTPPSGTNCVATAVCYTPQGTPYAYSMAQATSVPGINVLQTFNNRLQPSEIQGSSTTTFGTGMDITYNFVDPVSGKNAGVVYGITNNLNSARSQTFTYDQLNRIISAGTLSTTGTYCWGYQFSYDAWGNLLNQAAWTPNYNACSQSNMATVTPDSGNHINAFSYDASGNALGDGLYSYTYDGESQMKTAAGVTYSYDGDGRRVAKVASKLYWYGSGGEILAETDSSGNLLNEFIFFGGKRIGIAPVSGPRFYYVEDMLGSSRFMAKPTAICYDADFTPFGGERAYSNTCTQNNYKFEGKERDTETQNDDFGARYYTWRFGRWLSADWSSVPVAVPYANLTNPQTLNLYAMVSDDPESFADLDGHQYGRLEVQDDDNINEAESAYAGFVRGAEQAAQERKNQQSTTSANAPTNAEVGHGSELHSAAPTLFASTNLVDNFGGQQGSSSGSASGLDYKTGVPHATGDLLDVLVCTQRCAGDVNATVTSTHEKLPNGKHGPGTPHAKGEAADLRVPKGKESEVLQCAASCGAKFGLNERLHPSGPGVLPHVHIQTVPGTRGGRGDLPQPYDP